MNNQIYVVKLCIVYVCYFMFCVCVSVFHCFILCNREVSNHLARVDVSAGNSLSTPQY